MHDDFLFLTSQHPSMSETDTRTLTDLVADRISWTDIFARQHPNITTCVRWLTSSLSTLWAQSIDPTGQFSFRPPIPLGVMQFDASFEGIQYFGSDGEIHHVPMSQVTGVDADGDTFTTWRAFPTADEIQHQRASLPDDLPADTSYLVYPLNGREPSSLHGRTLTVQSTPGPRQMGAMMGGFVLVEMACEHFPWLLQRVRDVQAKRITWSTLTHDLCYRLLWTGVGAVCSTAISCVAIQLLGSQLGPGRTLKVALFLASTASVMVGRKVSALLNHEDQNGPTDP